jgi:hypothetical protein
MIRLILALVPRLALSFAAVIGIIHALPNDDDAVRAFLAPPDGCAMPCWEGIRPGETTLDAAMTRLRNHPWANRVIVTQPSSDTTVLFISWSWTGQQPSYIDGTERARMRLYHGVVREIELPTTIPLGRIWLVLGQSDKGIVYPSTINPSRDDVHQILYDDHTLLVRTVVRRPAALGVFWNTPVEIETANSGSLQFFASYDYHLPCWLACPPFAESSS